MRLHSKSPFYWTFYLVSLGYSNRSGKELEQMEYSMRWVRGHIEVYDGSGRFLFSADSEWEAQRELETSAA